MSGFRIIAYGAAPDRSCPHGRLDTVTMEPLLVPSIEPLDIVDVRIGS